MAVLYPKGYDRRVFIQLLDMPAPDDVSRAVPSLWNLDDDALTPLDDPAPFLDAARIDSYAPCGFFDADLRDQQLQRLIANLLP